MLYAHNHNNTTKKKDERRHLYKYMYLSLYCKGSKRLCGVLLWEGVGEPTELQYIDSPLMAVSVVSFSFSRAAQPEAPGAHSAGFLYYVLFTNSIGGPEPLRPGVAFLITSCLLLRPISNCLTSVLTELYNSSTSTQSPSRSLESHVQSSSSGNNCHAVHRSLSSGASVYECTMGIFTSSHFISQFPPTRFPLITAIRMCHLLPVHHLGMAFLAGSKAKIQQK